MRRMPAAARAALLLVLALHAASCGETDPPSSPEAAPPTDAPAPDAAVSYSGIPYGPYDLWENTTELKWGPGPFTLSLDNSFLPTSLAQRIEAARRKGVRLVLELTGGPNNVTTNRKFDLGKWKARMDRLNTSAIKKAVADGVADGTIVAGKLLDEPEHPKWGGVPTKAMIDGMATYVKKNFPTLPMGIGHGAPGFKWRSAERYKVLDWVSVQYVWSYNQGNVTAWRDQVLSFVRQNGVTPMFALNILNGGVTDTKGAWDCPNTGGKGTRTSYCRMTSGQVRTYGRTIGPFGCAMLMWRYDDAFMSNAANQSAFKDVASLLNSKPRRSCRRP
jgi:hypothetical protein